MKKFLSILLALAVGFTFTFGSAMSAFAYTSENGYDANEQKEILAAAKNLAVAKAADITENYDSTVVAGSSVDDITTYTIAKADLEKAIEDVYSTQLDDIIDNDSTDLNDYVNFAGNYDTTKKNTDCADVVLVAYKILDDAKVAPAYTKAEKNALDGYKTYLTGLVDKIDLSIYTDTVQDDLYTVDGEKYDTSAKAADAWVKYYKAVISNAVIGDKTVTNTTPSSTEKWSAASLKAIYNAVFNAPIAKADTAATTKIVVVKVADTIVPAITTDLTYKLSDTTLATKAGEAGDAATLAAAQAAAVAKLAQAVAEYKAGNAYDSKTQDAEIDAYVTAQTYRINNTDDKAAVNTLAASIDKTAVAAAATGTTYTGYIAAGEKYKADMATAKVKYTTLGYKWDDAEAAKAEVVALLSIYNGGTQAVTETYLKTAVPKKYAAIVTTDLTASAKAAAKVDYSAVEADETAFGTAPKTVKAETFEAPVTVTSSGVITPIASGSTGTKYFAKQWDAVKAAYDAYNTAVDSAVTSKNISDAGVVLFNTLAKLDPASTVYGKVAAATDTYANLNAYAKLVASQAGKTIYVTFADTDEVTTSGNLNDASVYVWMINKGASTKAEAEALYNDAKAVIDAYKTLDTLKAEANAVNAQIAALPAKTAITLTDKVAIVAAYDAYAALPEVAQNYVTNKSTLDTAVAAVKAVEEYALKSQAAALPKSVAAITVADKDALVAYKNAFKAYKKTTAYNGRTDNDYYAIGYTTALEKVKDLEAEAIKKAYDALDVKYQANTLTAEDAAAVKALQDALNAYIDEYAEGITGVDEFVLAKISALVGTKATLTDAEAKAYVQDLAIAVRTAKVGKKVKVTVNADVQTLVDNGYTVTYKFYKSTKKGSGYKNTVNKTTNTYTNTNPVKGKNYYKVKLVVKNADGAVVATTPLTQCKYGVRTIK